MGYFKKPKATKTSKNLAEAVAELFPDHLVLNKSDASLDEEARKAKQDEFLENAKVLNVKATHKTITVLKQLAGKGQMVNYVKMGIEALVEKKELTRQELTQVFLDKPLSKGTANAQSSQQMFMLPVLGVATRDGSTLKLNEDSTIAAMFTPE